MSKMNKAIIIAFCLICLLLCGCDDGRMAETRSSNGVEPIITIYGEHFGKSWFSYAVDERTGIVYLIGGGNSWGYMSPALNADGTPMLQEQLAGLKQIP